jgi:glycosyltransferase involved in cell wall biosynthesis
MTDTPKVTVLMPVYNGEKYLQEAVDSILCQTFTNFELLIIDDGSTDESITILESLADPRIRLVRNETNLKLVATRNKGLSLARGQYIALMDCDDISVPQRLSKQVAYLENNPDLGILGSACQFIDNSGVFGQVWSPPRQHGLICWEMCFTCPISNPTVMMRKSVIQDLGGYAAIPIAEYGTEDYELWQRAAGRTQLANLSDVLLFLRQHDSNITKTHRNENFNNSVKIGSLMISGVLDKSISPERSKSIRQGTFGTVDEAVNAGTLIFDLCQAFMADETIPATEKRSIRQDAASRIFSIAYFLFRQRELNWTLIGRAWQLDPSLVFRNIADSLCGKITKSLHFNRLPS